jgi:hypothetical protein
VIVAERDAEGIKSAHPGSEMVIEDVGLPSTRMALADVLRRFAADLRDEPTSTHAGVALVTVTLRGDQAGSIAALVAGFRGPGFPAGKRADGYTTHGAGSPLA